MYIINTQLYLKSDVMVITRKHIHKFASLVAMFCKGQDCVQIFKGQDCDSLEKN